MTCEPFAINSPQKIWISVSRIQINEFSSGRPWPDPFREYDEAGRKTKRRCRVLKKRCSRRQSIENAADVNRADRNGRRHIGARRRIFNRHPYVKEKPMAFTSRLLVGALALALPVGAAWAHTPLCSCYDNGDGTVLCEGGFSDGSSASGVVMRVQDASGNTVLEGKMDENSEFEFEKPKGAYKVIFDAGEGHSIEIDGKDIVE